jgi:hypothetical protein
MTTGHTQAVKAQSCRSSIEHMSILTATGRRL